MTCVNSTIIPKDGENSEACAGDELVVKGVDANGRQGDGAFVCTGGTEGIGSPGIEQRRQ